MDSERPILLVEDDSVDAMTVMRAMRDLDGMPSVVHKTNGEEALEYLRNDVNVPPGFILLDLNMPKMDGLELLGILKANERLRYIPVIVLTTSKNAGDIKESFAHSVAGYMVKPIDYDRFTEIVGAIKDYWSLSRVPTERTHHAQAAK